MCCRYFFAANGQKHDALRHVVLYLFDYHVVFVRNRVHEPVCNV